MHPFYPVLHDSASPHLTRLTMTPSMGCGCLGIFGGVGRTASPAPLILFWGLAMKKPILDVLRAEIVKCAALSPCVQAIYKVPDEVLEACILGPADEEYVQYRERMLTHFYGDSP